MKSRVHIHVSGHVQGVFFRYETKRNAEKFGVFGWVRNLPDGRVECVFEGEKDDVNKLIEFCKHGPPGAQVSDIKIEWENYKNEFNIFEIKHG